MRPLSTPCVCSMNASRGSVVRAVGGRFRVLGAGLATAALLVGGVVPAAATTTAARDANGTLHYGVAFSSFSGSLDPAASTSVCDSIALQFIYDGLIRNVNGAPAPGLASSWKLAGRTFTLTLRQGVKFQDGTPLDAAAVKKGLEHNMQGVQTHDGLAIISSIDVVDDHTVRLNLNTDTGATLPYVLSGREGMIVAPNTLAKGDAGTAGVGAGPFGVRIVQGWGMTETSPLCALAHPPSDVALGSPEELDWRVKTGRVMPGVELGIRADRGTFLRWR